jgi:hypothetical protein
VHRNFLSPCRKNNAPGIIIRFVVGRYNVYSAQFWFVSFGNIGWEKSEISSGWKCEMATLMKNLVSLPG